MGLNESYEATRRHILMLKPIPTIEDAFNMVTQDERQRNIKPMSKSDNVVFNTSDNNQLNYYDGNLQNQNAYQGPLDNNIYAAVQNQFRPRAPRPVCTYCGQTGHVIQKCFKKHGYPPGYIPGFKSNGGYQNQSTRPFTPSFSQNIEPRAQFSNSRPPTQHAANMMTGNQQAISTANVDVSQMNKDQLQSLLQQLNSQVQLSENQVPSPLVASVTQNGVMDTQSFSGVYSGLDDW